MDFDHCWFCIARSANEILDILYYGKSIYSENSCAIHKYLNSQSNNY